LVKAHATGSTQKSISRTEFQVIDAIRSQGEMGIPDLALAVGTTQHNLLDLCETLVAQDLIEFDETSSKMRLVRGIRAKP